MKYLKIKDCLYKQYYDDKTFSEVTSSHWRYYVEKTTVTRTNNDFEVNAFGISGFSAIKPTWDLWSIGIKENKK